MPSALPKKKPLISVIITNNNGQHFLPDCLSSLANQTYPNIQTILVDNNSSDNSIEYVEKNFPKVTIVKNKKNDGYAEGNNKGYRKSTGEYIVFMNNDVKLQPDLLEKLYESFLSNPRLGAVQPMIKLMNSPRKLDACGSFWTNTGFNYHFGIYKQSDLAIYNKPYPIYSLKGVCMMIPRVVLEKVGLFDKDFWCYFEETDLCHRIWLAGYECWYNPSSFLYHVMSGTRLKKAESLIQYHSFKNRFCSYLKNLGPKELLSIFPIYIGFNIISSIIYIVRFGNVSCASSVYGAIGWNLANLKETMKKRRHIQRKIRKVSDEQIFSVVRRNPRISYYYYLITGLNNYKD